ncbi:Abi family protein [Staphylococcus epidermidis]|nr:Abi family protein [Staphylococcus epidermidis]
MHEKKYISHRKKLELLRNRNMRIPKKSNKERNIIKKYNYYTLINGYKDPFLVNQDNYPSNYPQNQDLYIRGTKPSHIEALLVFDNNLRNIFLKRLLFIEETIKNAIVESFYNFHSKNISNKHNKDNLHRENEYLRRDYYDLNFRKKIITIFQSGKIKIYDETSTIPNKPTIKKSSKNIYKGKLYEAFVSNVYGTISVQRNKKDSLKYYLDTHRYIPMWVLMQVLTFGNISKMFEIQKLEVQKEIVQMLNLYDNNLNWSDNIHTISNIFNILNIYRNLCAHGERLFCSKTSIHIDDDYKKFSTYLPYFHRVENNHLFDIRLNDNMLTTLLRRKGGMFKLIFCISLFLNKTEFKKFIKEIEKELAILKNSIKKVSYKKVLYLMGLDFNWKENLLE